MDHVFELLGNNTDTTDRGFWDISDTHRGAENVKKLPIGMPGMSIHSMMVLGINANDMDTTANFNHVLGNEDRVKAIEMKQDYFFHMIHLMVAYVKKCRAMRDATGLKEGDAILEELLADRLSTNDSRTQADIESALLGLHAKELKEDKSATPEDVGSFAANCREMIRDSTTLIQVVVEILPRAGHEQRSCHRVRWYAMILAKPNRRYVKTWNDALKMLYEGNKRKARIMRDIQKKAFKAGKTDFIGTKKAPHG